MAASKVPNGAEKLKRSKKRKSRTEVEVSSSESDSGVKQKNRKPVHVGENGASTATEEISSTSPKKVKPSKTTPAQEEGNASTAEDGTSPPPAVSSAKLKSTPNEAEDFTSIYLRKVTAELADDLDKVREANDFKASSLPMLINALKQGESIYSAEEKRRVVSAANP
ncbi:hypothetical protein BU26DRAFT_610490 [Trematosphaeria pertusa]|uniref:Ribosome assembly protein 3 n=1 Tax=Trematosphaeria pertusa TaxID=390896 RepID=A0A6A6HWJ4_9PLEO|nr:uncharacterized protein BU26DRAFT_610490 [Trematosphaeria pertusa]KAF2242128.1 hypothetical protein BU26DRAFT_610490 [Trematosphaeria pertusa]